MLKQYFFSFTGRRAGEEILGNGIADVQSPVTQEALDELAAWIGQRYAVEDPVILSLNAT